MEFTQIISAFGILFVGILAIVGMSASFEDAYGENALGDGLFSESIANAQLNLTAGFVDKGLEYAQSTTPQEGQGTSTDQGDNLIKRAWNSITLMGEMLGLTPALLQDAAAGINIPTIYVRIANAVFWTIFAITMAYLLIIGARKLLPG